MNDWRAWNNNCKTRTKTALDNWLRNLKGNNYPRRLKREHTQ